MVPPRALPLGRSFFTRGALLLTLATATAWAVPPASTPAASPAKPTPAVTTATVTPYPRLPELTVASDYQLTQDGRDVPIYEVAAGRFALLRATGPITLNLSRIGGRPLSSATLRPTLATTPLRLKSGTVTFRLSGPGSAALELDGDQEKPLFLFVNPPETPPAPSAVTYFFGPGQVHVLPEGKLRLRDGESAYIAGGALVQGVIEAKGTRSTPVKNIRIYGQGVVDPGEPGQPLTLINVQNAQVEGLTLLNSKAWSVRLFDVSKVRLSGLRIFATGPFSDGLDIMGASDVTVRDCFIHSQDDCVAIKGTKYNFGGNVERVSLENLVIWKALSGNGIEIGYETGVDYIRDITVRNIAILHVGRREKTFRRAALSIHNSGHAEVSNVLYEDITIEQASENLIYLGIAKSAFAQRQKPGVIRNVTYRRVRYLNGPTVPSVFDGADAPANIHGITFTDCSYLGNPIKTPESFGLKFGKQTPSPTFR